MIAVVGLPIALFVWAASYVMHWAHRGIALPQPAALTTNQAPAKAAPLQVTADMLHVSAIALGKVQLAVVNGEELKEGDMFKVKTPAGDAIVNLTQIKDGVVRFKYRSRIIDVPLSRSVASKAGAH